MRYPEVGRIDPKIPTMKSFYVGFSVALTNFVVLIVALNLVLFIFFQHDVGSILSHNLRSSETERSIENQLWPGWSEPELSQLISETVSVVRVENYDYDEITQLRLRPQHSRYVNVEAPGFRRIRQQGPWPLDRSAINVFVFGGSTTFGLCMDDDDTIPSFLQELVGAGSRGQINVYNFGRPGYTSTQELLLYLSLLRGGFVPSVAVFIDGLNDSVEWMQTPTHGFPWPDAYVYAAIEAQKRSAWSLALQRSPMGDFAQWISAKLPANRRPDVQSSPSEIRDSILKRWLENRSSIAALSSAYRVKVAFVWQPVAAYKYDLRYDMFRNYSQLATEKYAPAVYLEIEKMEARGQLGENFLNLAGIQRDQKVNLYVDPWHYNKAFSREIASRIGNFLRNRQMLQ